MTTLSVHPMIRIFSAVLLLVLSAPVSFAQITYEKGYFVDNEGKKQDCLIRNMEWLNNPVKFEFKFAENGEKQTAVIDSVAEFGVEEAFKYLRRSVRIDTSSTNLKYVSRNANPEFKEKVVFLKVLEEGAASLYQYRLGPEVRYLYSFEDHEEVSQLISKTYKNLQGSVQSNQLYKQQLLFLTGCEDIKSSTLEKLYLGEKDLLKLFRRFNHCGEEVLKEKKVTQGWKWQGGLRVGAATRQLELRGPSDERMETSVFLDRKIIPRYGLELEVTLPFNRQKWGVLLELIHTQYDLNGNMTAKVPPDPSLGGFWDHLIVEKIPYSLEGSLSYLNYAIGIRNYFYLNNNSKLFLGGYFVAGSALESKMILNTVDEERNTSKAVAPGFGFGAGAGYKFHDRLSLEIRHMIPMDSSFGVYYGVAIHHETNLTLGYNLFK